MSKLSEAKLIAELDRLAIEIASQKPKRRFLIVDLKSSAGRKIYELFSRNGWFKRRNQTP